MKVSMVGGGHACCHAQLKLSSSTALMKVQSCLRDRWRPRVLRPTAQMSPNLLSSSIAKLGCTSTYVTGVGHQGSEPAAVAGV